MLSHQNDSKKSQSLKSILLYILLIRDTYNVIISPEDIHTIKLNHIKFQDPNIIKVINSVITVLDSR